MNNLKSNNGGMSILASIVFLLIVILVLGYYKVNVRSVMESPTGQDNINYVKDNSKTLWEVYLKEPVTYIWKEIIVKIFLSAFVDNMKGMANGGVNDLQKLAPVIQFNTISNLGINPAVVDPRKNN